MKRMFVILSVIALCFMQSMAMEPVAKGKTYHELGDYIIEKSKAPLIVDARILPTYEVSYENSYLTVRIGIDRSDKKCTRYIVVSDNLSIQYNCNGKYLGAVFIDSKYVEDGISNSCINLDRAEYFRQKVLTQTQLEEMEQIKLISVFFPKLVNNYDRVFAVK